MSFMIILLTILGGLSKIYKRFIPLSIGLELKTFFTIIIAYAVSPSTAVICAAAMVLISAAVAGRFCHWILIKIMVYTLVCIIVAVLAGKGVIAAGKAAVIFLNASYLFFNALFKDFRILSDLPGNAVNIVMNFFLLNILANPLVSILG